ncbi:MAG TPA: hypothetical protein VFA83_17395 [Acidimicrobiales bacterium]|nr:hypothetical protein [Acidimicrobiales bacterium]
MTAVVRDVHPPTAVIRVLNPVMRTVLRSPLGRLVRPFALLEFAGRRSGRRYRVPAGWYVVNGQPVVFSPAPWRVNFAGGATATVRHRGRAQQLTGTLVTDPDEVATALTSVLATGISPRAVGLDIPPGHTLNAADVLAVDRALIRFRVAQ